MNRRKASGVVNGDALVDYLTTLANAAHIVPAGAPRVSAASAPSPPAPRPRPRRNDPLSARTRFIPGGRGFTP